MAEFGSNPGTLGLLSVVKSVTLLSIRLLITTIFAVSKSTTGDTCLFLVESVNSNPNDFSLLSISYSLTLDATILGSSK